MKAITQNPQAKEIEAPQRGDALLYAGLLALMRVLTAAAMLAVLMVFSQAGLRALPWTDPVTGWLLVGYVLGAALFYAASYFMARERLLLIDASFIFDLAMLTASAYFSDGTLTLFALLPVLAISVHRGVWSGLMAAVVFAAHLPFVWPPLGGLEQLPIYLQVILLGVQLLATLVWVALSAENNSNLLRQQARQAAQKEKLAEARSRKVLLRSKTLYNIAYILSSTLNFESVMRSVFDELERALPIDAGMFLLIDTANNKLRVAGSHNLTKPETEVLSEMRGGQVGRAVGRGTPAVIDNLKSEEELVARWPRLAGFNSLIVVPLRSRFELFGVLIIGRKDGLYDQDELDLMTAIGNNSIIALQNASIYENLREERDKVVNKEDDVRRQVARELHDGPGQTLALIAMKVEFIKKLLDLAPLSGLRELDALANQARQANQEVRGLLFELRPAILESNGLVAALSSYVQRFPADEQPAVHYQAEELPFRLPLNIETTAFNIAQEAITNARKHARARHIWLNVGLHGNRLALTVQDDGQGFDTAAQHDNAPKRGAYGILNMRERAAAVDGELQINSIPGRGTTVTLVLPLNRS